MDLSKKVFVQEGLRGIIFIVSGIILQLSDKFSDVVFYAFTFISLVLIITIVVIKVITMKKKSEPVDELAKRNRLKAESVLYKILIFLGLGVTFLIYVCFQDEFEIILNWHIVLIILGSCDLAYCFLFNFYENSGEVLSD